MQNQKELTIRDKLAFERTVLANERTLLSYVRTMIGMTAVGGSILKFFAGIGAAVLGSGLIALGILIMLMGLVRYWDANELIKKIEYKEKVQLDDELMWHRRMFRHLFRHLLAKLPVSLK